MKHFIKYVLFGLKTFSEPIPTALNRSLLSNCNSEVLFHIFYFVHPLYLLPEVVNSKVIYYFALFIYFYAYFISSIQSFVVEDIT